MRGGLALGTDIALLHSEGMKRPTNLTPPQYLSPSPPVPEPSEIAAGAPPAGEEHKLDPTRYGDWEKKGVAIDF